MGRYDTFNVFAPKRDKQPVGKHSHYNEPIDHTPGRPAGVTRDWGDVHVPVQDTLIDALIGASKAHHLSKHDAALILAIVRDESGFNPDAANKEWSASGPGMFMDKTGPKYGVTPQERFDIQSNANGVVQDYLDCKKEVENRHHGLTDAQRDRWIYKYYHDWLQEGRGFKEFDKPDGVKQWISPIEKAISPLFESPGPPSTGRPQPHPREAPAKPLSSLDRPLLPNSLASRERGSLAAPELVAGPNRFLSPGPSRAFHASFRAPSAPYPGEASPPLGSLYLPRTWWPSQHPR